MKKLLLFSLLFFGLFGLTYMSASADMGGGGDHGHNDTVAMGEFEGMQAIMEKMMDGEALTDIEKQEMLEHMEEHHGSGSMMRGGDMSSHHGTLGTSGMMMGGTGAFGLWIFPLTYLVWLLVGILLSVFLIKKLGKTKNEEK